MKIKISLAQTHVILGQPEENLVRALSLLDEAHRLGSSFFILPELWSCGYDLKNCQRYSRNSVALLAQMSDLSKRLQMTIGGTYVIEQNGQFYNTFYLLSPAQPPVTYHKMHLFKQMDEGLWFKAGNTLQTATFPHFKAGLATCYDLRFPELFRLYALQGVQVIFLAAEWTLSRVEHWKTLLRARAIENQIFIAAVNAVGNIGGVDFAGSSAIITPWGEVLIEGSAYEEALLTAEIDLDLIDQTRKKISAWDDRRPDVYSLSLGKGDAQ